MGSRRARFNLDDDCGGHGQGEGRGSLAFDLVFQIEALLQIQRHRDFEPLALNSKSEQHQPQNKPLLQKIQV